MKKVILFCLVFCVALTASFSADAKKKEPLKISSLPPLCETIGEYMAAKCKNNPKIRALGCDDILPPPEYWGGLQPFRAMAICVNKGTGACVRESGCSQRLRERFVVLMDKNKVGLKMLNSKEEFRQFFTPLQNEKAALSYVAALTNAYPLYSFPEQFFVHSIDENGKYLGKPKPTEVKKYKGGYKVRLFDNQRCGCHRPELLEVEFHVTKDGYIKELKRKAVWQANRLHEICID